MIFSDLTWFHPLTHPSTHQTIHPNIVGVSSQIINLQIESNCLNWVKIYLMFSDLTWPHTLTFPFTHPLILQTVHPPISGGVVTDLKSSNRIKSFWLVQDLFGFFCDLVGLPLGGGWVDGTRGGWGNPTHVHAHMHMHVHTHINHDKHIGGHLQFLYMNF